MTTLDDILWGIEMEKLRIAEKIAEVEKDLARYQVMGATESELKQKYLNDERKADLPDDQIGVGGLARS